MAKKRHINQDHIDAALEGSAVAPGLEALNSWAAEIREQAVAEPALEVAAAQISAIARTASAANPGGAGYAALKPSRLERVRRRLVFGSLLSGIGAKVFAASVALATATGGVAATGSLPDAIQDPIAGVYNTVGFDFPTSHDDDCEADHESSCDDEDATDDRQAPGSSDGEGPDDVKGDSDKDDSDDDANDNDDSDDDADDDNDDSDDDADDDDDSDDDADDDDSANNSNNGKGKGKGNDKPGGGDDDSGDDDQGDSDPGDDDQDEDGQGGEDEE